TLADGVTPGANFSQINPATLGLDGAIWGHNHGVAEGAYTAHPFNLGLQSVIDRRTFRIFRVSGTTITPGPLHKSGGLSSSPTDPLTPAWSGPNAGTRASLSVTVTNRFLESWDGARLLFNLLTNGPGYTATGGSITQTIPDGPVTHVYVDCVLPAAA